MTESSGHRSMKEQIINPWAILFILLSGGGGMTLGQRVLAPQQAVDCSKFISVETYAGHLEAETSKLNSIRDSQKRIEQSLDDLTERMWGMQGQGGGRNSRSYSSGAPREWPSEGESP